MQRSGSTWSFNIVVGLLERCRPNEEIYAAYNEEVADFLASVPHTARHTVLKCHLLDPIGRALARSGQAKAIYTWRNLPDAVASFLAMFGGDFEHAFLVITASLVVYRFHARGRNALMIGYDDLIGSPRETIARIASHIGLDATPEIIADLAHEQSIEEVLKRVEQIGSQPANAHLIRHEPTTFDPGATLHRHHILHGGSGYGAERLTKKQLDRLEALREEYGFFCWPRASHPNISTGS